MRFSFFDHGPAVGEDEENALSTDVMRFMAIIAFCLLVVFIPLVKSMPDTVERQTEVVSTQVDTEALMREIERLSSLNTTLIQRVIRLQERLTEMTLERVRLAEVEGRLRATRDELRGMEQELGQERDRRYVLQSRLDRLSRRLREHQERIEGFEEALDGVPTAAATEPATPLPTEVALPVPMIEPTPVPEPTSAPVPQTPGRQIVRFASHEDLLDLIGQGELDFVIHTYGKLFRVVPGGSAFDFDLVDRLDVSERTYYMPEANVPLEILRAFRQRHANLASRSWEFYLKVSEQLELSLQRGLRTGAPGAYVIHRDGRVAHEAE